MPLKKILKQNRLGGLDMYQKYNVHGHVQKNEVIEKLEKVFDENT